VWCRFARRGPGSASACGFGSMSDPANSVAGERALLFWASEPAFSARDAQFFGNCHRTWCEVNSQYRDHSLAPFTEGQLPLRWLAINTMKSQRRGS